MKKFTLLLTGLGIFLTTSVQALVPFGSDSPIATRQIKAANVKSTTIDSLSPDLAGRWEVEDPLSGDDGKEPAFAITDAEGVKVLNIKTDRLEPGRTTVRILLPGDASANGKVWDKDKATFISFLCRSNQPAQMTFHLLQRGKSAGTFKAAFTVKPGEWQRVILPVTDFGLKNFKNIAGMGVRLGAAEPGTTVSFKDFQAGATPMTNASWKSHRHQISINGEWHFATDPGDKGSKEKWFASDFDDSTWKTLQSGKSWQEQGIEHSGWGWYRQKIFIPKEMEGVPLTLTLSPIPSDDDTWFNGERIGGFSSEYKYNNWMTRTYTVPPSLIQYGAENTIAIRIWGGDITFIGNKSGLIKGPLVAEFDPYGVFVREPGGESVPFDLFDLTDAQRGKPFEMLFSFPSELAPTPDTQLQYEIANGVGEGLFSGAVPLKVDADGVARAVIPFDAAAAQKVYLSGRLQIKLLVEGADGMPLYTDTRNLDRFNFTKRDKEPLPAMAETFEETPYGKLKLIDVIDCSTGILDEIHPYAQSGFDHGQDRVTAGSEVDVTVSEILGKKARESSYGWFAYRLGRGKLKPHTDYLVRIEYPEDKPRIVPIEIQSGQNFMDVGWKNGVGADDPYDNWPLSKSWQWYDVIFPLDDITMGTGGTGSASSENGFWIYFMNKMKPGAYYAMWSGGPAIARIKLYELDVEKNAPVVNLPEDLPHRTFSFDWERQPDHEPSDLVRYAKLMGYNAISPVIIKWAKANYSEPLNGYMSVNIDAQNYWAHKDYDPKSGKDAEAAVPGKPSVHVRYLEATKKFDINYIPRFEWGGSQDLPQEAWALDTEGNILKPNRFAQWCSNLLNPLTWNDLKILMDHLIKPYAKDNPQLAGVLWRIRSDRVPISYGPEDIKLFSEETKTPLPAGNERQWAAWAAGEMKKEYDDWWHQKRADFHIKLANLLQSYRSDLRLYYYNWDPDKFGLINTDITAWAFVSKVVKPAPDGGRAAYEKERAERKSFTAKDYISVMHSGNFGDASKGINRADYGIRPELYKNAKGIEIFAPSNYLCYADKPDYLNYFQTAEGLAVSNVVSYDEIGSRSINPKYEGNMLTPANGAFSMALELLAYFNGDARTLNYTVYTYGRGFADAHRRFAQAFLALPALPATIVDQGDEDLKVRTYDSDKGTYVGVAYKGYAGKKLSLKVPAKEGSKIVNLVTNKEVPATYADNQLQFEVESGPMELNAFKIN